MAKETAFDNPEQTVVIQKKSLLRRKENGASSFPFVGDRGKRITLAILFGILLILLVVFIALYCIKDQKPQCHNGLKSRGSNKSDVEEIPKVDRGRWVEIANDICIGARDNSFKDVLYPLGPSVIGRMKLVHTRSAIGCHASSSTYWGCVAPDLVNYDINMYITNFNNHIIFPSKILSARHVGGWYKLPGYNASSPELVFTDFDYLKFFKRGQKLRVWYGEDLLNYTEHDNHGRTCMDIWVYILPI